MVLTKKKLIYYGIILVITISLQRRWKTAEIPDHLLGHTARFHPEFISVELQKRLLKLIKETKVFPWDSDKSDIFFSRTYTDIGEDIPIGSDGTCSNPYLIPNQDKSKCILEPWFAYTRHFLLYGGLDGLKENFTFHFIIQVPGQTAPVHIDNPYFEDATMFQYPPWLLEVMAGSGLYQDTFIDQVQGVGYLHEWNKPKYGGQFAYFDKNTIVPTYEKPTPRSVMLIDGSKTIHASTIYKPKFRPPIMAKDAKNELVFSPTKEGDETWELRSNDKILRKYHTDDLRINAIYRARCFESEEKRKEFNKWYKTPGNGRPIEEILNELKEELVNKRDYDRKTLDSMPRFDLALVLVDEFVKYPWPTRSLFPYNYCALPDLYPWTEKYLKWICF
uniref:Uncharacterized protein n=1 Tax=Acrobeloides nanus TaxID=290746 RepID=A0A914D543_9BILA